MSNTSELISLIFQFVASFCWAIGAGLAGPVDIADYLQFTAAIAWCVANFASAWFMYTTTTIKEIDPAPNSIKDTC